MIPLKLLVIFVIFLEGTNARYKPFVSVRKGAALGSQTCDGRCGLAGTENECACHILCGLTSDMLNSPRLNCCPDFSEVCPKITFPAKPPTINIIPEVPAPSPDVSPPLNSLVGSAEDLSWKEKHDKHPFSNTFPFNMPKEERPSCDHTTTYRALSGDCTQYYRCVNFTQMEVYQIFYFECPVLESFNTKIQTCMLSSAVTEDDCYPELNGTSVTPITPPATQPTPEPVTDTTPDVITEPAVSKITPPIEEECGICYETMNDCAGYSVCPNGATKDGDMTLCREAFWDCDNCPLKDFCSENPGYFFNPDEKQCYPNPNSTAMACGEAVCTKKNEILDTADIRLQFCSDYPICSSHLKFTGTLKLCDSYYQCDDNLKAVEKSCPDNKKYSYHQQECRDIPTADLCVTRLNTELLLLQNP